MSNDGPAGETSRGLFPELVATDRLRLERLTPENPEPLTYYEHTRPGAPNIDETTEHVTWGPNLTPKEGLTFQESATDSFEKGTGATYAVRPRNGEPGADTFAGTTGIGVAWEEDRAELGIWLRKPFWGRGYAGERADALLELAFARLDLACVTVAHYPENENSRRAITKYVERHGGRREGTFRNRVAEADGAIHDVARYSVTQEEWARSDGAETAVRVRD